MRDRGGNPAGGALVALSVRAERGPYTINVKAMADVATCFFSLLVAPASYDVECSFRGNVMHVPVTVGYGDLVLDDIVMVG